MFQPSEGACKIENLPTMAGNGYSKALLSQRLSGAEAKEGLCISVYLKHQTRQARRHGTRQELEVGKLLNWGKIYF